MSAEDSKVVHLSSYYQFDGLTETDPLIDEKLRPLSTRRINLRHCIIVLTTLLFLLILLIFGPIDPLKPQNLVCEQTKPYSWRVFSDSNFYFPIYSTHDISIRNYRARKAIIVQHGNLRNGKDYFCAAIHAAGEAELNVEDYIIVAPQFFNDKDLCWNQTLQAYQSIDVSRGLTCNFYIWTSEGWKDGKPPVNGKTSLEIPNEGRNSSNPERKASSEEKHRHHIDRLPFRPQAPINPEQFFSYDVYNLLINQLAREDLFPNLEDIVLFGFSAGGQTLLRYSLYPNFNESALQYVGVGDNNLSASSRISVKTIVGDVSSYLYFDERRPFTNRTNGFGVPQPDWILDWKVDAAGSPWIGDWNEDKCSQYNDWRFGLDHLDGYYLRHSQWNPLFRQSLIAEFPHRNIQFLVGLNDSVNCRLRNPFLPSSNSSQDRQSLPACDDNELATYCQAMLQGDNRLDRFLKWRDYINQLYRSLIFSNQTYKINNEEFLFNREHLRLIQRNHLILYVEGMTHDAVAMIRSVDGKCLLFDDCPPESL